MIPSPPEQLVGIAARASSGRVAAMTLVLITLASFVALVLFIITLAVSSLILNADGNPGQFDAFYSFAWSLVAGIVIGAIGYIATACVTARGLLPSGQRAVPVAVSVATPPTLVATVALVGLAVL